MVSFSLVFQSTRPAWGATRREIISRGVWRVSIHAPRVGRDWRVKGSVGAIIEFQSTRPAWGATRCTCRDAIIAECFNPRAPRGARLASHDGADQLRYLVSIHAPRVGRDTCATRNRADRCVVSIHAPRVGRDAALRRGSRLRQRFNPRAPRGARRDGLDLLQRQCHVSIHAPRVGRDLEHRP